MSIEYDKMIKCIIDKTYKHGDIISKCTNKTMWTAGITNFFHGMVHSTKIYPEIFPNDEAEQEWQMNIYLQSEKNYFIII